MILPELNVNDVQRDMLEEFKGYNHKIRCAENEFYDMKNLSGDNYPVLSTRAKRGFIKKLEQPQGLISKKGISYVDNGVLYINNEAVELKNEDGEKINLSPTGEKNLIKMGAYLIILSDKVWYNTENREAGRIEQENAIVCEGTPVTFATCGLDGEIYNFTDSQKANYVNCLSSEPDTTDLKDGYIWFDTVTGYLKKWAKATSMWVTVSTTYVKISAPGIGKGIKEGDAVDIEGCMFVPDSRFIHGTASLNGNKEPDELGYTNLYLNGKVLNPSTFPQFFEAETGNQGTMLFSYFIVNTHLYSFVMMQYQDSKPCFQRIPWEVAFGDKKMENLSALNTSMIVQKADKDYIIVTGIISTVYKQIYGTVKVSRTMPIMDFVIENNNRLWGCRYGANKKGEIVNEIYASKQGDFKNWSCYAGISTDSYAVTVGSDGEFTGAVSYGQYPYFFKENCIHRIAGAIPSQFQMVTTNCRGIQKGSEKSLAETDEVLFYKSANDICIFSGSLPSGISDNLGNIPYKNAVGGCIGHKYYVSMLNPIINKYELFVYDMATSMWHKEDNTEVKRFARVDTDLYFIDSDNNLMTTTGKVELEDNIKWGFETGVIGYSYTDNKYLQKLLVRLNIDIKSVVSIYIKYNSTGNWELIGHIKGNNTYSYNIPIKPKRCDHFAIKFEGVGECKVFSISKYIEQGSDRYV